MIVVEGVDNSGKSTLIRALHVVLPDWRLQGSEGPPKYKGEMDVRVQAYGLNHPRTTIYDRHPCVSQPIYGTMRSHLDPIASHLITEFYDRDPIFIYCDGGDRGMKAHVFNPETDTEEHLMSVKDNYDNLLHHYRSWAAKYALISYRVGDSVSRVVKIVEHLANIKRL